MKINNYYFYFFFFLDTCLLLAIKIDVIISPFYQNGYVYYVWSIVYVDHLLQVVIIFITKKN